MRAMLPPAKGFEMHSKDTPEGQNRRYQQRVTYTDMHEATCDLVYAQRLRDLYASGEASGEARGIDIDMSIFEDAF